MITEYTIKLTDFERTLVAMALALYNPVTETGERTKQAVQVKLNEALHKEWRAGEEQVITDDTGAGWVVIPPDKI